MVDLLVDAKNRLTDLITRYRHRVDYLSIRLESGEQTNLLLRGDRFETLSDVILLGGQVRACYRGGWGFTSFNRMEDIATQIENTIAVARLIG
ncbi:MAG: PmbA/TldA family metallopeptidase, partial [Synechococcales cyanobacterium]